MTSVKDHPVSEDDNLP